MRYRTFSPKKKERKSFVWFFFIIFELLFAFRQTLVGRAGRRTERTSIISMKRMNKHPRQDKHLPSFFASLKTKKFPVAQFLPGQVVWWWSVHSMPPLSFVVERSRPADMCVHVYIRGLYSRASSSRLYSPHVLTTIYGKEYANGGLGMTAKERGRASEVLAGPFIQQLSLSLFLFFFFPMWEIKKLVEKVVRRRRRRFFFLLIF